MKTEQKTPAGELGDFLESLETSVANRSDDWGFIHGLRIAQGALDLDNEYWNDVEDKIKYVLDEMRALASWLSSFEDEISIETRKRLEHVKDQSPLCREPEQQSPGSNVNAQP
jgi:hypothetical protein